MTVTDRVAATLEVLRGKALWDVSRAANLHSLQFGDHRMVNSPLGKVKEVGEYALHIQCSWRIVRHDKIVVASRDRFYPAGDWDQVDEYFDWDHPGANRCDERMEVFVGEHCPTVTEAISVDEVGGFRLTLERGFNLEVFPDDSTEIEHWRLFEPGKDLPHAVFSGNQLQVD